MPVQKWWLLLTVFISIFLSSVYGITAQNSVINNKNFVQRIFFELLYRAYKTPKFLGYVLYESPSIKYVSSEYRGFMHPIPPVCLDTLWWHLSQQRAHACFLPTVPKKTLRKLFRFVSYLRKSLLLTFLFSDSHVRADNPGGQSVKHNVWGWIYFWALAGIIFLPWLKLKESSKRCSHRHFSKYLQNNSRTHSNHHKNYAKTLFCSRILHLHFQSHSLCESPSN